MTEARLAAILQRALSELFEGFRLLQVNENTLGLQKVNSKRLRNINKEIAPEPVLKAPPPTPCISFKQRSGSVPDFRFEKGNSMKKEKVHNNGSYYRSVVQTVCWSNKPVQKSVHESEKKRSTSEHSMASGNVKGGSWAAFGMGPCTSNLLHSVRQRLMNL